MKTMMWSLLVLAVAACGKREAASPMEGMTAEEHAKMVAGGTQGAVDTAGQVLRQPVRLTPMQEQALGVRYTTVERAPATRTIRTVGQIQAPEPGIAEITTKVDGFVERLFVNATGDPVRKGQPILALYSPMVVAAQEELLAARRLADQMQGVGGDAARNATVMLEAVRRRLAWWDVPAETIVEVERSGVVQRTVTLVSPVDGVVLEKMVVQGQQVMAGMRLYRVADLSSVWVVANVFEQDLSLVQTGQTAAVSLAAYPGRTFTGKVTFVYPTVEPETRTARIRIELPNKDGLLKPDLYGTVEIAAGETVAAVSIPESAVLDSGTRQIVLIERGGGAFEPREVELGSRGDGYVAVLKGLAAGERVVVNGNFLIDAESNLKAALGSLGGHAAHGGTATPASESSVPAPPAPGSTAPAADEHAGH